MMVGPSGSGKSHFIENVLLPSVKHLNINTQVISSDSIRREIIGNYDMHRYHPRMMQVSNQAFTILETKLNTLVSYPVNADLIIIDSTGLNEAFRHTIKGIANKWNYHLQVVLFDYKNREDYHRNSQLVDPNSEYNTKQIVERQIKALRQDVLKEVNDRNYGSVAKIRKTDYSDASIEVKDFYWNEYNSTIGSDDGEYVVVGDVHGCWDELKELLESMEFQISNDYTLTDMTDKNRKVIFIGDIIDKGPKVEECVRFVSKNQGDNVILVIGNHENFVYKYLKGSLDKETLPTEVLNFFDSRLLFAENEELKNMFYEMVDKSVPFYKTNFMHVCHAPVENKHIGKYNNISRRKQRSATHAFKKPGEDISKYIEAVESSISWIKEEADFRHPWHIHGHISFGEICIIKNKYLIDTGCVSGGKLTAIVIKGSDKPIVRSVDSKLPKKDDIIPHIFKRTETNHSESFKSVDLSKISFEEAKRIRYMARNKVNFISGTMSPSNKSGDILESLEEGLNYYQSSKTPRVIIQKKYMGSRGNVYLFDNVEESYAVSRNGYKIKNIDFTEEFQRLRTKYNDVFDAGTRMVLFDCEILPWRALGAGLIDESFMPVMHGANSEIEFLKNNGFLNALETLRSLGISTKYEELRSSKSKSELRDILGDHTERTLRLFKEFESDYIDLDEQHKNIDIFRHQLDIFGGDSKLSIAPFSILKTINKDGTEKIWSDESNIEIYHTYGEDDYCVYDFVQNTSYIYDRKSDTIEMYDGKDGVNLFWKNVTEQEECEGVVIKPEIVYQRNVAPYMKVRNSRYLTIVYGHDYLSNSKYQKLLSRKSIRAKLNTSIKEWELGQEMLKETWSSISEDNELYKVKTAVMISVVTDEKKLDPRL